MADFALSDVDVVAVSICKGPANRKRILLKKQDADPEDLIELSRSPIIKVGGFDNDWTVFYTVVAEPEWEEKPGVGKDSIPGTTDVWASEDEILKAAHSFMRNGGLINLQHQGEVQAGKPVESFVCPADMIVETPDGPETIKKGSWVIGIEPDPVLKQAINAGDLDGVSYEGTGLRTRIEKAKDLAAKGAAYRKCPHCEGKMSLGKGKCPNCGKSYVSKSHAGENVAGPIRNLIAHYMKQAHPFRACVRDNTKRFGPERAKEVCATLKDMGTGTHDWRKGSKKGISKAADLPEEFYAACEENWRAAGLTDEDATIALEMALASEDRTLLEKIAGKLGLSLSTDEEETDDMALTDEQTQALAKVSELDSQLTELTKEEGRIAALEGKVTEFGGKLDQVLERLPEKSEEEATEEQREQLQKSVEKMEADLAKAQEDLAKLAEGDTSQSREPDDLKKSDDPDVALAHALID